MAQDLTPRVNQYNVEMTREMIRRKQGYRPVFGTETVRAITDQDVFPYPRYFRGVYNSSVPVVFEREAGWRSREDHCYRMTPCPKEVKKNEFTPDVTFQIPCSTILPDDGSQSVLRPVGKCLTMYR